MAFSSYRNRVQSAAFAALFLSSLSAVPVFAACTLSSPTSWTGTTGNWFGGGNWDNTDPNNAATNVCITNGTVSATQRSVSLNNTAVINNLQLAANNSLTIPNQQLQVNGASIINDGQIALNGGGGGNAYVLLYNTGATTLSGAGSLTLTTAVGGGNTIVQSEVGAMTLNNSSNILGAGSLGAGTSITLNNSGIINANSTGGGGTLATVLSLNPGGSATNTNTNLIEATNNGTLELAGNTLNNSGGNITANGANASVQLDNGAIVQGGTLNALSGGTVQTVGSATLDGITQGAITVNGTYLTNSSSSETFTTGTLNNNGNFQINGGNGQNAFILLSGNTTLQGSGAGTVTLTTLTGGGSAYLHQNGGPYTLTNTNNVIQGEGVLGDGTSMTLINQGTVNANSTGGPLTQHPVSSGGRIGREPRTRESEPAGSH